MSGPRSTPNNTGVTSRPPTDRLRQRGKPAPCGSRGKWETQAAVRQRRTKASLFPFPSFFPFSSSLHPASPFRPATSAQTRRLPQLAPWHGHLGRASHAHPGRVRHGQDARGTHGRDARATSAQTRAQRDHAPDQHSGSRPARSAHGLYPYTHSGPRAKTLWSACGLSVPFRGHPAAPTGPFVSTGPGTSCVRRRLSGDRRKLVASQPRPPGSRPSCQLSPARRTEPCDLPAAFTTSRDGAWI